MHHYSWENKQEQGERRAVSAVAREINYTFLGYNKERGNSGIDRLWCFELIIEYSTTALIIKKLQHMI